MVVSGNWFQVIGSFRELVVSGNLLFFLQCHQFLLHGNLDLVKKVNLPERLLKLNRRITTNPSFFTLSISKSDSDCIEDDEYECVSGESESGETEEKQRMKQRRKKRLSLLKQKRELYKKMLND